MCVVCGGVWGCVGVGGSDVIETFIMALVLSGREGDNLNMEKAPVCYCRVGDILNVEKASLCYCLMGDNLNIENTSFCCCLEGGLATASVCVCPCPCATAAGRGQHSGACA